MMDNEQGMKNTKISKLVLKATWIVKGNPGVCPSVSPLNPHGTLADPEAPGLS